MQGDIIGCLLHMPEGGRAFEKEKSVSSACTLCPLPQHVPCSNLYLWGPHPFPPPLPLPLPSETLRDPKPLLPCHPTLHHAHPLVWLSTVQCA